MSVSWQTNMCPELQRIVQADLTEEAELKKKPKQQQKLSTDRETGDEILKGTSHVGRSCRMANIEHRTSAEHQEVQVDHSYWRLIRIG